MNRTYINEVQKEIGNTVKVQGFIENLRNSKYMAFIVLKDITGKLQITVEKEDHPDLVDTIDQLTPDSVITLCPSSARRSQPPRKRRRWSVPASTSALITAGSICAPTRTS